MSNEDKTEGVDQVLDILSNPLSRYILSVLAGIDPGKFTGTIRAQDEDLISEEDNSQ